MIEILLFGKKILLKNTIKKLPLFLDINFVKNFKPFGMNIVENDSK